MDGAGGLVGLQHNTRLGQVNAKQDVKINKFLSIRSCFKGQMHHAQLPTTAIS